jgi:hypothetical protein
VIGFGVRPVAGHLAASILIGAVLLLADAEWQLLTGAAP